MIHIPYIYYLLNVYLFLYVSSICQFFILKITKQWYFIHLKFYSRERAQVGGGTGREGVADGERAQLGA